MTAEAVVVGAVNAGKSLFAVNFAGWLGQGVVRVERVVAEEGGESGSGTARWSVDRARHALVSAGPHKTLRPVVLVVPFSAGSATPVLRLVDTPSLVDGVPEREDVRRAMVDTLRWLERPAFVLHVVDAPRAAASWEGVDRELSSLCAPRGGYALLANKTDLAGAGDGVRRLRRDLPGHQVIGVSALTRRGFPHVLRVLSRHLAPR